MYSGSLVVGADVLGFVFVHHRAGEQRSVLRLRGRVGVILAEIGILGDILGSIRLFGRMGAFHQPDAADDEDHTDHHIRQAVHDEIEGAENGGGVAPAVDEVAESVHDEVLVGDERTEGDEQPAHQLVAVQQSPGQPLVAGVEVDEVVVLRRGVRDDLRPEVEGVKEAARLL